MAPQDRAGRIPKLAFLISTGVFLATSILAVLTRFTIRLGIQRQQRITTDDAFIILAAVLISASAEILYARVVDLLYLTVAIQMQIPGVIRPADWEARISSLHRWYIAQGILSWSALCAVKLSFLFFFRALIWGLDRRWRVYWWVAVVFNMAVVGAGFPAQFMCPALSVADRLRCFDPSFNSLSTAYGVPLVVGDIIGEILILLIPISIIYSVKIRWTQKVLLSCILCLTIIIMLFAILRLSHFRYRGAVDLAWQVYWQVLASEVGIVLATAATVRSLFVARRESRSRRGRAEHMFSARRFVALGSGDLEERSGDELIER